MRRIITGHNNEGKSVISIDGPPARSIGEEAGGLYEIWNTDGSGFDTKSKSDRADIDFFYRQLKVVLSSDIFRLILFQKAFHKKRLKRLRLRLLKK